MPKEGGDILSTILIESYVEPCGRHNCNHIEFILVQTETSLGRCLLRDKRAIEGLFGTIP